MLLIVFKENLKNTYLHYSINVYERIHNYAINHCANGL